MLLALFALLVQSGSAARGAAPIHYLPHHSAKQLPSSAGDWPTYGHDNSRTSYNPEESTISAANIDQLVSRWQANVGMSEYPSSSSPSVAEGRVYVGSSASSGPNFFAFDAVTGAPSWNANLGFVNDCSLVGIGSTSAISGGVLAVGGGDRAYYGFDAITGAPLWRDDMNVGDSGFAWASPLFANGRTYIGISSNCDAPSVRGEVRALDALSGTLQANQYFVPEGQAGAGIWNSPALSPDGNTLVVTTGEDYRADNGPYNRAIVSLDPVTLQIRQSNQQGALNQDQDFGTTPVFFHDNLGRSLVGANHKDDIFYAYEVDNIQAGPIWQLGIGTNVGMMPAYDPDFGDGGTLIIGGQSGVESTLYAVDPATGAIRWGPVQLAEFHGNVAIANGLIFVNAGRDGVRVLDEATGAILRTIVPDRVGVAFSGIAVAHGFVYWLSGAYLNAWSLPGYVPPSATPTFTGTPPTATPTSTVTPTVTGTPPTFTPTRTPTVTNTPRPPTNTPTATPTRSCALNWGVIDSPNADPTGDNVLQGVSSYASDDTWAVGYYRNSSVYQTLVQFWNGASWSLATSPNAGTGDNYLQAVFDRSGNDAWAVGYYRNAGVAQTLILHFNGISWNIVPSPNAGTGDNFLLGVAARADDDAWATGYYRDGTVSRTLIIHWDGTSWSRTPSPNSPTGGGVLQSVLAFSASDAWAVGFEETTLIEHWDGTSWSVVPSPNAGIGRNILLSVSGTGPSDIWAAGYYRSGFVALPLTLHWDGTQWSLVPSPVTGAGNNPLQAVVALASNDAWAVGYYEVGSEERTLVQHWDGLDWHVVSSPSVGSRSNTLNGIAVQPDGIIWAAGAYGNWGGPNQTLIEGYNNPCATPTPTVTPAPGSLLVGHVTWQGSPPQPDARQQLPITLTLKSAGVEENYPVETTDASGFFTVNVSSLLPGQYDWRVKGHKYLAAAGVLTLVPDVDTQAEMGLMLAGDANDDDVVDSVDFNVLHITFGLAAGDPGYDERADFNNDNLVDSVDFNLLKRDFGVPGPGPIHPGGP